MTVRTADPNRTLPARASVAAWAVQASNWLARTLGRGSGTVAGGRVGLALDPSLLATLARGRRVALVTGTNGKTTTTRMLVAALSGSPGPAVVSNDTGANMPAGHVAALAGAPAGAPAVLEVDEGYLGRLIADTAPRVVLLLNLSRDQLDRISEVRMLVDRWRAVFATLGPESRDGSPGTTVVANADDPMVTWAAMAAPTVRWVGAGQVWRLDAVGCPACGGRIAFEDPGGWACRQCTFARPQPEAWLEGPELVLGDGTRLPVDLGLPGQFNRANAAMVVLAAPAMTAEPEVPGARSGSASNDFGTAPAAVLSRVASVEQVAGRFSSTLHRGHRLRLLLAKNPAGWTAIFDLLDEDRSDRRPVVLSVNARTADGFDTSWLWDVPFERLAGRVVVATGDRRLDLGVRLRYAGVAARVVDDPLEAVDRAGEASGPDAVGSPAPIDFVGNYTAFADLRARCDPRPRSESGPCPWRIAVVYPDLLGTYGDGGNGVILARRAEWRGIGVGSSRPIRPRPCPSPTSTASGAVRTAPRSTRPRACGPMAPSSAPWPGGRWCWACAPVTSCSVGPSRIVPTGPMRAWGCSM